MANEETVTITETAPDGTETTVEITSTKPDDAVADDKSIVEEVVDALFDTDVTEDENETANTDVEDPVIFETAPSEEEISADSVDFTVGEDGFPVSDQQSDKVDASIAETPNEPGFASPDIAYSAAPASDTTADAEAAAELADQEAHSEAAEEVQAAADEFVAQGDYAAAAEARETAENEAYAAGDNSMLGASDSGDMENAAWNQEIAEDYRQQQADHIAEGNYEAAKEDAQNAAYATGEADYQAGGSDHTGQSEQDVANLDNAVWNEKQADDFADNAEWYAEAGNPDAAQSSLDHAGDYQATADTYADHADPMSSGYDVEASSAVASGGSYDGGYDAGGYDASISAVDTGFDAGADMSTPSYDTSGDDTV